MVHAVIKKKPSNITDFLIDWFLGTMLKDSGQDSKLQAIPALLSGDGAKVSQRSWPRK